MQPSVRKRPVVLLVEDEFVVRIGTRAALETAGFDVIEAGDADEAIAILAARDDIRLIFTDIHMPGSMDGGAAGGSAAGSDFGPRNSITFCIVRFQTRTASNARPGSIHIIPHGLVGRLSS